jgi:hypothetical protein
MPFSGNINVNVTGQLTTALDLEGVVSTLSKKMLLGLTDGTGANQANNCFSDTRTLAASATESLDLSGALLNAFGQTIAFTRVKALMIFAAAGNTNDVVVGGAGANGFISPFGAAAHTVRVKPGGSLILTAPDVNGYSVTAATADLLQIANSAAGTPVTYDVIVIGA